MSPYGLFILALIIIIILIIIVVVVVQLRLAERLLRLGEDFGCFDDFLPIS